MNQEIDNQEPIQATDNVEDDAHRKDDADAKHNVIHVRHLYNSFDTQSIHENLNLSMKRGEILGVVGGSGAGKSVLMRSIIGLHTADSGDVHILGEHVFGKGATHRPRSLARRRVNYIGSEIRRKWGVLFQGGALFSTLTVSENIQVPLREFYPHFNKKLCEEIAQYKIRLSGLPSEAAYKYPAELSGGMKKRAGLARALALDPELLFLDEPTAGLDPIGAAQFDNLIRELQETLGLSVFLITHDLDTLYAICDRVAVLADKHLVANAKIDELLAIDHPWINEYFMGPRGRAAKVIK